MNNLIETPFDVKVLNFISTLLLFLFGGLIVTGFIAWYIFISSMSLKKIIIYGNSTHHSISSFKKNIVPVLKGNFFSINLKNTRIAFESLPWISSARVKRVFPNRIEIYLQEHKPVALWGMQDGFKMINADGVIFDSSEDDHDYEELPQFIGPEGQSSLMLDMYTKINTILMPLKVKLVKIELSTRGSWTAILEGGAQLELGRGSIEIIAERIKLFTSTLDKAASNLNIDIKALQYSDLRHTNGYALKMNGITTIDSTAINLTAKK